MRKAPEVVREVGIYDVRVAMEQQLFHLDDGLLGVSPGAAGVDFRRKIGFEDRLRRSAPAPASLLSCTPDRAESRCPAAEAFHWPSGYTLVVSDPVGTSPP